MNEYTAFYFNDSSTIKTHISKILPNGTISWSKVYGESSYTYFNDYMQLSTDENTLMLTVYNVNDTKMFFFNIATGK